MEHEGKHGKAHGGTIIRGDDGSLHFIRDETLKATKITEPEMAEFCSRLLDDAPAYSVGQEGDEGEFVVESGVELGGFKGPFDAIKEESIPVSGYTSMCPGTMGAIEFEDRPPFRA